MKIGYARVSTDDQDLALQIDALTKSGCDFIYKEQGVSGAKKSRPQLDKMLSELKSGDMVVVWRLDRLGRSLSHLIELIGGFRDRGVQFQSICEYIDTSSAIGELIFHMIAAFAQFERRVIGERVKAGKRVAIANGSKQGAGYKYATVERGKCSKSTYYRRRGETSPQKKMRKQP